MWASIWEGWQKYLIALTIYSSSRLIVLWAMYIAARFVSPAPEASMNERFLSSLHLSASTSWYRYLLRWDSIWYVTILNEGYNYNGNVLDPQSVQFYPLYPLTAKALTIFPGIDGWLALLVVANVAAALSVLLLFKYVRQDYGDEVAFSTIAFLSFFPSSLFLSAGYTESLTLLLILTSFLLLKQEKYVLAAACAGLASATRSTGVVLLPVISRSGMWNPDRRLDQFALIRPGPTGLTRQLEHRLQHNHKWSRCFIAMLRARQCKTVVSGMQQIA